MSALPPKADIHRSSRNVRFGPYADSCTAANSIVMSSLGSTHREIGQEPCLMALLFSAFCASVFVLLSVNIVLLL
jgi:hypothetical protein